MTKRTSQRNMSRLLGSAALLSVLVSGIGYSDSYIYDDLGRLVLKQSGTGGNLRSIAYSYDAAGNRTSVVVGTGNHPPVANSDWAAFDLFTGFVDIYPLDNDTDPDGDTLSIQSFTQPRYGFVTQDSPTQLTYECDYGLPQCSNTTFDVFNYTVSDGKGGTATTSITIQFN